MTEATADSAVLLCVPETEPLVHALRGGDEPSPVTGVPAHVTLLAPFLPAARLDDGVTAELEWFFSGVDGFPLAFTSVTVENGSVRMLAEGRALDHLADALVRRWPEAGVAADALPPARLTIVHSEDPELRDRACIAAQRALPLVGVAAQAALWVRADDGRWREKAVFELAPAEHEDGA